MQPQPTAHICQTSVGKCIHERSTYSASDLRSPEPPSFSSTSSSFSSTSSSSSSSLGSCFVSSASSSFFSEPSSFLSLASLAFSCSCLFFCRVALFSSSEGPRGPSSPRKKQHHTVVATKMSVVTITAIMFLVAKSLAVSNMPPLPDLGVCFSSSPFRSLKEASANAFALAMSSETTMLSNMIPLDMVQMSMPTESIVGKMAGDSSKK
mmetsp:Transcript_68781/g.194118  ORF Transcript_68781/g.194118 Transcript_68781/m.194118 type:complete len:208 (+) Transcript_68781:20-643(+)